MTFYGADPGLISSRSSLSWHRSKKEGADYYSLHSRQVSQEMHFHRLVKMQNRRDTTGMMVLTNGWLLVKIESFPRQYSGRGVVITVECWPKCIQWNYLILFRTNHSLGKQSTNQVPQLYRNLGHFWRSIPLIYPPCDRMPSIMGCLFWMGSARKGFRHLGVDPFGQNLSSGSTLCNQIVGQTIWFTRSHKLLGKVDIMIWWQFECSTVEFFNLDFWVIFCLCLYPKEVFLVPDPRSKASFDTLWQPYQEKIAIASFKCIL